MDDNRIISENLVDAWINLSSTVWNRRVVSSMTFNEISVCNLLIRQMKTDPEVRLTATDLCEKTRLFKSQMNKVLNSMEKKAYIRRVRSEQDKRFVYIEFTEKGLEEYTKEHEDIMRMVDKLVLAIGKDRIAETAMAVNDISEELRNLI